LTTKQNRGLFSSDCEENSGLDILGGAGWRLRMDGWMDGWMGKQNSRQEQDWAEIKAHLESSITLSALSHMHIQATFLSQA